MTQKEQRAFDDLVEHSCYIIIPTNVSIIALTFILCMIAAFKGSIGLFVFCLSLGICGFIGFTAIAIHRYMQRHPGIRISKLPFNDKDQIRRSAEYAKRRRRE
jgi:hypothetical protein